MSDRLDEDGAGADDRGPTSGDRAREALQTVDTALTSTTASMAYLSIVTLGVAGLIVLFAYVLNGLFAAVGAAIGLAIGVSAPWIYVRIFMTPMLKQPFGAAFAILGQLTFGAGALVRRQDGSYEWTILREDEHGLYAIVADGRRVSIDGERSDLPEVAWAPLAIVEEKTDRNMAQFTVDETFRTERPDPVSPGETVQTPLALTDGGQGWHLDSSKIERWTRGAGNSDIPRNGRRKALEEHGGQQRISQLVTMLGAGVLLVLGFGMTAVVMML